jgi:hypothetical protein
MIKKPCKPCHETKKLTQPREVPRAIASVAQAQKIRESMTPILEQMGYFVAAGHDPVIALLILRRRIGFLAEQFEGCPLCRKDIELGEEHDQYMIDAKQARMTWVRGRRREAARMYWKFQSSVLRGIWMWVVKPWFGYLLSRLPKISKDQPQVEVEAPAKQIVVETRR